MGIRVGVHKLVYVSTTMETIDLSYLGITKEQILEYLKEHPYPDDPEYSKEDMIGDITGSSGFYSLPMGTKPETDDFIATLLNDLI